MNTIHDDYTKKIADGFPDGERSYLQWSLCSKSPSGVVHRRNDSLSRTRAQRLKQEMLHDPYYKGWEVWLESRRIFVEVRREEWQRNH